MEFGDEGQSFSRLSGAVDAARESGFAAVAANDHFLFQTPWLDGATALAAAVDRSGDMELATTVANVALRGPVPLAKTLAALDVLSDGRVVAGVGPGSSERDYDAVGVPFEERWERFDEAVAIPPYLARRWRRRQADPAESRFGSGAGAQPPVFGASRVSATGGSHPRTTRRPTVSGPRSSRCPSSWTRAARMPIACCERSWPRCSGAIQIRWATSSASDPQRTALSCSRATRRQAASAYTSGHSA